MSATDSIKAAGRSRLEELNEALNEVFLAVLRVDMKENTVRVLHNKNARDVPESRVEWPEYLERYTTVFSEKERRGLLSRLSGEALMNQLRAGRLNFTLDTSYKSDYETNWLTISVNIRPGVGGENAHAYIFVRRTNEEHLLRSIIDLFVYSTCDYFIYLNARTNSYVMFSGNTNGTPLPPATCDDYETAIVDYAERYVVPEDREMTVREMRLGRVLEQLEHRGVHSFTVGVMEKGRGYTRKRLEYRYYDRDSQMILLARTDVTDVYFENLERTERLREAQLQAETDPLTGVLNYGGLHERVTRALEKNHQNSALLFIDLDDFKLVNDTMGHHTGDELLRRVTDVLRSQLWERDICGRVGGDEFVVFLPELHGREQAIYCAERLCESIAGIGRRGEFNISCSIGVAYAPEDGTDYASLSRCADARAYAAKARGKNCYHAG
ncbi:MAG TPA: GGDEF domain-containing protein [Candidatus Scatomorpha merdigallinarum]|nr:GGDEF domain-containing protein [Candidatus Scatomorpha merdigallinarum]